MMNSNALNRIAFALVALFALGGAQISAAHADGDQVFAAWEGTRASNGKPCVAQYRQIEFSQPEFFISYLLGFEEKYDSNFAGLVEMFGLNEQEFKNIFFGQNPEKLSLPEIVVFSYDVQASMDGQTRRIEYIGKSTDENSRQVTRRQKGVITLDTVTRRMSVSKVEERRLANSDKFATVFKETCENMTPVQIPGSAF